MKNLNYLFIVSLFLLMSCVEENSTTDISEEDFYGKITFSFNAIETKTPSKTENTTPTAIFISGTNENNEQVFENNIYSLTNFSESYLTDSIDLPIGKYTLTDFNVINSDNEVILSTPLTTSEFASLLNAPLPIDFTVTDNKITNVIPEVLYVNTEEVKTKDFYVSLIKQTRLEQVFIEGNIQIVYADGSFNTTTELSEGTNRIPIPVNEEFTELTLIINTADKEKQITYSFEEASLTSSTNPFEIIFIEPYNLTINATNTDENERNLEIIQTPRETVKVKLNFTADENISRLYITKNTFGSNSGPIPYEIIEGFDINADGSTDIANNTNEFIQTFDFDGPKELNETVEYKIWVTTGKGDFRDASKRNSIAGSAYGTIRIKGGETAPSINTIDMKSFSTVFLSPPLTDASSYTFFSLYNNESQAVNQQEAYTSFLDFGYFYGASTGASFYSVYDYPKVFGIDPFGQHISEYLGIDLEELNHCYFAISTIDFDNVSTSTDLDIISHPSNERIQGLKKGDVIEFLDGYGSKGLIKVTQINGTYNSDDYISFDVKVQMNPEPIKLQ